MADEPKRNDGAKPSDPQKSRIEPDQPTPNRDKRREPVTLDLKAEPEKPMPAEPPKPAAAGTTIAESSKPANPVPGAAAKSEPAKPSEPGKTEAKPSGAPAAASPPTGGPVKPEPLKPEPGKSETAKSQAAAPPDPKLGAAPKPASPPPKAPSAASPPPPKRGLAAPILASAICAAVVAFAVAYGWQAYTAQDRTIAALKDQLATLQDRLDTVDKQVAGLPQAVALSTLQANVEQKFAAAAAARTQAADAGEQRLRKLETIRNEVTGALEKRVGSLEALTTTLGAQIDQANTKAEVVRIQAARAIEAVAKASATPPGAPIVLPPTVDVAPIKARLEQVEANLKSVEATLAKPKTDARATEARAVVASPKADPANLAIVAQALSRAFDAGAPYQGEIATLEALGAGDKAVALKPFAEHGAPKLAALKDQFETLRPAILASAAPPPSGGYLDRLAKNASGLFSLEPTAEVVEAGTSPTALVGQIEAALGRGDTGTALAAWTKLPPPAQKVSQAWAELVKARNAAWLATQALASDSIAALAKPKS